MNRETIRQIADELRAALSGRTLGKVFQLSPFSLAMDFGLRPSRYLFISIEPAQPRIYLIARRSREIEKQSLLPSPFVQAVRSALGNAKVLSVTSDESERIVRFSLRAKDELGKFSDHTLVAQLTGRSANLFLLDELSRILQALRPSKGRQQVGEQYEPSPAAGASVAGNLAVRPPNRRGGPACQPPLGPPTGPPQQPANKGRDAPPAPGSSAVGQMPLDKGSFESLSAAADDYFLRLEAARSFDAQANAAQVRLRKEITQRQKLKSNLKRDLEMHGDAEQHKRLGDLLLANIFNARRQGKVVEITDYFAEGEPTIEVQMDESVSLQDLAARYFARYTKAKRAIVEISKRLAEIEIELARLENQQAKLEEIIAARDETALDAFGQGGTKRSLAASRKHRREQKIPGARRYQSSDGYEVLVGRAARDNDYLTFKVARSSDLWLHAADYPGSHVVVRNPTRKEIPHRTIIEAAQLAAKFSQASGDAKVDVHYTERKFLVKPKGAALGLVRMSTFRTITVEPREGIERIP